RQVRRGEGRDHCPDPPRIACVDVTGSPVAGTLACPTWTTWLTRLSTVGVMRFKISAGQTPRKTMITMSGAMTARSDQVISGNAPTGGASDSGAWKTC